MRRWRSGLGACLLLWVTASRATLDVSVERVAVEGLVAEGVRIHLPAAEGGPGAVHLDRLSVGGRQWRDMTWHCGELRLSDGKIGCEHGRLTGPAALAAPRASFDFDTARGTGQLSIVYADGSRLSARRDVDRAIRARLSRFALARLLSLGDLLPADWQAGGRVDGEIHYGAAGGSALLRMHAGAVSDATGLHAAEGVEAELTATLAPDDGRDRKWTATMQWKAGDVFWSPVLISPGWSIAARGQWRSDRLNVDGATLTGPGLGQLDLAGSVDLAKRALVDADVRVADADLSQLVPQLVLPLVLPDQQSRWRVAGQASAWLQWRQGAPQSAQLDLSAVGFSYLGKRFRVGPFSGVIPWHRGQASTARLQVDGLHWQKLDFKPFALAATVGTSGFELQPTRLPVLDGAIMIDALAFDHNQGDWRGQGQFYSEPISLKQLTGALELPEMAGTLSASIPGVRLSAERIDFDGTVVVSVFDGFVQATGLEVIDPFGLLPRLNADIRAEHLDLEQLTQTFSFGAVSGFIDARVDQLVMAAWRPLRFDARVDSSSGDYRRRISQRAVEHITALGGAGAMAAIQRSMLMFFNDFGYRRIGFGCRLRGNVCQMSGLDDKIGGEAPFMLVEGGGIPALNVIGYNRRVDWTVLVDRLLNATAGDAEPIVK